MFIDEVEISVKAGRGGDGVATFRREKFIPKGGPDGGDGGNGGSVYLKVSPNTDTLSNYQSQKQFQAENGVSGKNKKMYGRNGEDLVLKVPAGTLVYEIVDNKKKKIIDLVGIDQKIEICRGGKGGLGNVHFKSSTNQTPREFTPGTKGERKRIYLELQLVADIGLVGLPNSGKSTILSVISKAKPKIGNYPFTTLIPNLGVVEYTNRKIIVADIPGIIEKASEGKGLGIEFLKHITRTKINALVIDGTTDVEKNIDIVAQELKKYSESLFSRLKIIIINKIDLISPEKIKTIKAKLTKDYNCKIVFISALNKTNISKLIDVFAKNTQKA